MKKYILIFILLIFIELFGGFNVVNAQNVSYVDADTFIGILFNYVPPAGYSCLISDWLGTYSIGGARYDRWDMTCTKTELTSFGATQEDYRTLVGYGNYSLLSFLNIYYVLNTPFLYLQNPPAGNISVKIDSEKDKYYPKPDFNQENGWLVESKDNKLSVSGEEKDNLFYELETSKITLNRSGKNFSSKDEVIDYLNNSDFLTKLGFSEEEKNNSLEYFIPKLKESKDNNFYYLTILSDKSVKNISTLNIDPKPENIIRQYFAVYPTPVPVKTNGEFKFPENKTNDEFTVKETGEFLVEEPMQVFFE